MVNWRCCRGRHYYRNYYKELFCTVVQHKAEALTKNIEK